jgi:isoleucyl-tRNA synthetase
MPGRRDESVFLETWYTPPVLPEGAVDSAFWNDVIAVRQAVAKEMEKLRVAGDIGSGLDAEVDLYCDAKRRERLLRLGDELRFVFIASYVRVHILEDKPPEAVETEIKGLCVLIVASVHPKCIRCWHHREDVGLNPEHPQICARCVQNVTGPGEARGYA